MDTSSSVIALKQLAGNQPTHLYPLQQLLEPYVHVLNRGWLLIWCVTTIVLLARLLREYLAHRRPL